MTTLRVDRLRLDCLGHHFNESARNMRPEQCNGVVGSHDGIPDPGDLAMSSSDRAMSSDRRPLRSVSGLVADIAVCLRFPGRTPMSARSRTFATAGFDSALERSAQDLRMKLPIIALAALLLGMPTLAACQANSQGSVKSVPATPVAVKGVVFARRFALGTPYLYTWAKEPRSVSTGILVVLEVDPAYVVPRNTLEPVLYAGNVAVHRLNHGDKSGRVIGIVPGEIDLATAPIWFGTPQLPERLTPAMIESERASAEKAGIRALPLTDTVGIGQPAVAAKDLAGLLRDDAARLVDQYSPQDKDIADAWRLPVARPPPGPKVR
jgi:hypothetical protein